MVEAILDCFREPLWESKKRFIVLQGGGGSGKAVPASTKVITPFGYKLMRDIEIGDVICDTHGGTTKVLNKYHPEKKQMYKLVFDDGREVVACKDHLWDCWVAKPKKKSEEQIISTEEMFTLIKNGRKLSIPISDPTYHTKKNLIIDPYLLGLLIGDEYVPDHPSRATITSNDKEIEDWLIVHDYTHKGHVKQGTDAKSYNIINIPINVFRLLDLAGKHAWEKKIPTEYLYSSIEDRLELLRGLLDTDGTVDKGGRIQYCTTSKDLSEDVAQLVRSLGGKCTVTTKIPHFKDKNGLRKEGGLAYTLYIRFKDETIPVFKIKRKQDRIRPFDGGRYDMRLRITSIEKIDCDEEIYCIKVDATDNLFLIEDYVVTHNSKSICQRICNLFLEQDDVIISVIRAGMPILKRTVYVGDPSIVRTLRDWGVPVEKWWNKTDNVITNPRNNSEIRFIGLDDEEKIKSQNWNYCWLEEATEETLSKWAQCNTRMRRPNKHGPDQMFISYNPISIYNWVLQLFIVSPTDYIKENSTVHFSNFLDNPFLPTESIISMFDQASRDENYFWTYVVGRPGIPVGQIYTHFKFTPRNGEYHLDDDGNNVESYPAWDPKIWDVQPFYGIDWGYVDPTVIVEVREYEGKYYAINRYYESERTMNDIIDELKKLGVDSNMMIYCDSAEADRIDALSRAGFCANKAMKSRHAGIMDVKSCDVIIDSTGKNGEIALNEVRGYSWAKDKDDPRILLDEPDKDCVDHFCLIGGTLIETDRGQMPIKDIKIGDRVLTRKGYRKVVDWAMTDPDAEVYTLSTDSTQLTSTLNHKIWCENKKDFIALGAFRYGDKVLQLNAQMGYVNAHMKLAFVRDSAVQIVVKESETQPVYNITVEGEHEYFANGILVSNCDSLRYAIVTHRARNVQFSTGTLMGEGVDTTFGEKNNKKKTSKEILEEMRKQMYHT